MLKFLGYLKPNKEIMDSIAPEIRIRLPMMKNIRSLNPSNSAAIISYEAWRQKGFSGGR